MSKIAAIDAAIRLQLVADGKAISYELAFDAMKNAAGAAAPYDSRSMRIFLLNVSNRLRLDEPAWQFPWSGLNATEVLSDTIPILVATIAEQTSAIKTEPEDAKA